MMPILSILFCSIYTVVDGIFVSNFTNPTAFAALNIMANYALIFPSFGFMVGSGGSALIGKFLGEGRRNDAERTFSMLVIFGAAVGVALGVIAFFAAQPFAVLMGAEGELLRQCLIYGRIMVAGTPLFALQFAFQSFAVAAGEEEKGLLFMLLAGGINIVLDAVFVAGLHLGLAGAGVASVLGQAAGAIAPFLMFLRKKGDRIRFRIVPLDFPLIGKACWNGVSEMLSILSSSIVGLIYEAILIRMAGEAGVDAYGAILFIITLFTCIFMGYGMGIVPVISYHYGAGNRRELRGLLVRSTVLMLAYAGILFLISECFTVPLAKIFLSGETEILSMTVEGFRIYAVSILFTGFNMFGSSFYTALNNGTVSAALSMLRILVLPIIAVLLLSQLFALPGVWASVIASEGIAFLVTCLAIFLGRKKYYAG